MEARFLINVRNLPAVKEVEEEWNARGLELER
jgi:hypothetical protein